MEKKLPQPREELVSAIDALDEKKISKEVVRALLINIPSEDELNLIRTSRESGALLDKPELLLLTLSTIPELEIRLRLWCYKLEFNEMHRDIGTPLIAMRSAISAMRQSVAFKKILGIILSIGNYLNGGTNKGQADGFNMETSAKISSIKDVENKSLVDYIKNIAEQKYPGIREQLNKDLQNLADASSVSMDDLKSKTSELQKDFSICQQSLKMMDNSNPTMAKFFAVIPPFMEKASEIVSQLQKMYEQTLQEFQQLLNYFGVSSQKSKSMDPGEFFRNIREFTMVLNKKNLVNQNSKKLPSMAIPLPRLE